MQLTELLFQKVKGLGGQGQLALKPGYVALVSRAPSLRVALVAPLCPAPDDQQRLVDGEGPTRVGLGLLGAPGQTPHRVLRELGGARTLQRFDAATAKFVTLTDDALEIDSFLRVECGMVQPDAYTGFFVLEPHELPSVRAKGLASVGAQFVDQPRVQELKAELELTRRFEGAQDRLFKVQARLQELGNAAGAQQAAKGELAALEAEVKRSPWTPEQIQDLIARAARYKDDLKKRDKEIAEVVEKRQRAARIPTNSADLFVKDPWFYGGALAGAAIDALAFLLAKPWIALLGLLPFLAALVAVLRWIELDENDVQSAMLVKHLKERDEQIRKHWDAELAPIRNALKSANVDSPSELLELFAQREAVAKQRDALRARVAELQKDPEIARVPIETPVLEAERTRLEDEVHRMGFSRPVAEIEADLKHAMGLGSAGRSVAVAEGELPKSLVARAAELLALPVEELWGPLGGRLAAYLTALTDRRVASGRPDEKGNLLLVAADGRTGPFLSLPPALRDLVYVALRLALLERVAAFKRLPVVVDDTFAALEPARRALISKMLKGISASTQVLHRVTEAPPPGTADAVLQA